ncbi:hypothetical protein AWE51_19125 [Aquimarina aggregata]|uniref:eCIS core domain-containing protein n=1 Tax=Aquimarina aggregata TaxID=1642818 RepID=A0A162WKG4_9FLAO|nr:DUF4157 domain-containing protein [Aquimarina aggregata]KZS38158.1 hypothetical protein AWE51_19125 [Aquimarina aggregata]
MKTAEIKTSSAAKNPVQAKREPFFKKEGEEGFFSKSGETSEPFFSPASIQPKLTIGQPNDKYEVEADKKADQVVQKLAEPANPTSTKTQTENLQKKEDDEVLQNKLEIQRKPIFESNAEQQEPNVQTKPIAPIQPSLTGDQDEEIQKKEEEFSESEEEIHTKLSSAENPSTPNEESTIQRKEEGSSTNTTDLESSLNSSKGSGSALPSNTQESMGNAFGADFSGVRTHTGGDAIQMNKDLGSQAFTHGNDIYFNEGKYNTNSTSGQHLLAHELTHTMQQGASKPTVQKVDEPTSEVTETPTAAEAAIRPNDALDISHRFDLTTAWANYLDAQYNDGERIFDVDVKIGERYSGTIKVNKTTRNIQGDAAKYELSEGNHKYLNITGWNFLNPMREAGVEPILVLRNFGDEQQTKGFLSVKMGDRALVADVQGFIKGLNDKLEAMDFLGIEPLNVDALENTFENGRLVFQVSALTTVVDGFLEAGGGLGITGDAFTFNLNANVDIQGLAQGQFTVARGEDGKLSGRGEIQGDIANVQATIIAEYIDGAVTIQGTGTMTSEKFTGSITLLVTDAAKSRQMMNAALGVETMDAQAETAATPETAAPKTKNNQVLAGWGEVQAKITPWLEGTAKIGIDHEGHVTIVGEIVVPDEIELMEQRGKKVQIFDVEIRAGYGIPLVGQVFLFAGIGMFVNAGFGPLVLKDVGFTGTYSTDPSVLQQFSITGTLGINAFAVLGLEAEAGVGVTLLGHDVKAGVNVTAAAGLRAYAEATPTFQYTESAAPEGGKVGESRLKGHFEAAAQLFLQLSGALFYELDSPWWSPAPDGREETPLGEVQYPIGDSMGIGADIDWLVGSSDAPELKFSPVEFDPDKFTADVMADPPPRRMGDADANPEGQWTGEPGGEQNANPEVTGDGEGLPPSSRREENLQNLPDEQKYMRALDEMSQLENVDPKPTEGVVEAKARRVKAKYGLNQIQLRNKQDDNVSVFVRHAREDNGNHLLVVPLMSEAERRRLLSDAMTDLRTRETNAAGEDGTIEEAAAQSMLQSWLRAHPAIESARVVDGGETWDYLIDVGDRNNTETGRLKGGSTENAGEAEEHFVDETGEDHRLYFEGDDINGEIIVRSAPRTLDELFNELQPVIQNLTGPRARVPVRSLQRARELYDSVDNHRNRLNSSTNEEERTSITSQLKSELARLANSLIPLMSISAHEYPPPILPPMVNSSKASGFTAEYLNSDVPTGSAANTYNGATLRGWVELQNAGLTANSDYVKMHLLPHELGGDAVDSNLVPAPGHSVNTPFSGNIERNAINSKDGGDTIWYRVRVSYHNGGASPYPKSINASWGKYEASDGSFNKTNEGNYGISNIDQPFDLEKVYLNESSTIAAQIRERLGINLDEARLILAARSSQGSFRNVRDVIDKISAHESQRVASNSRNRTTSAFYDRLDNIESALDAHLNEIGFNIRRR